MLIIPVRTQADLKKPPLACVGLILINILVLFFLQSGDSKILSDARQYYEKSGLITIEVEAYRKYLAAKGDHDATMPMSEEYRVSLAKRMVSDEEFSELLENNTIIPPSATGYHDWREKKDKYTAIRDKSYIYHYGYSPRKNNLVGLFTCMYLHGGVMHLVGNMVFLWLVGAILEAAVGTVSFLALYTVAGICASALFGLVYPHSPGPLVGASGAIAGLMGAYGVIFGLRKIRVFYSLGFYFNYANVPALALFPVWLANEFLQLYINVDSNIAYVAHIGGLLSGIVIGTGYRHHKKEQVESLFIGEQKKSEVETLFDSGMNRLASLEMSKARADFLKILAIEPDNSKAIRQLFIIDKGSPASEEFHQSTHRLLQHLRKTDLKEYLSIFEEYQRLVNKPRVTVEILEQLSFLYLSCNDVKKAAACIGALLKRSPENGKLPAFLYNLSKGYHRNNRIEEAKKCLLILSRKFGSSPEGVEAARMLSKTETT